MSESLKIKWPAKVAIPLYEPRFGEGIEVIPADLGRELYGALKVADNKIRGEWDYSLGDVEDALTRYEREVGDD